MFEPETGNISWKYVDQDEAFKKQLERCLPQVLNKMFRENCSGVTQPLLGAVSRIQKSSP